MKKFLVVMSMFGMVSGLTFGQIAQDDAGNYLAGNIANGANEGFGFTGWGFDSDNGGRIIQDANQNGASNLSALNTGAQSFAIFADGFSTASRSFASLTPGGVFSFQMGFQWDNGDRGFNLYSQGDEVFNFNINNQDYSWTGGSPVSITEWSGLREFGVLINAQFTATATGFTYQFSSAQDANLSQTGSITAGPLDSFQFYVSGAGGAGGNLAFNNLQIIPEPGTLMLLLGGMGTLLWFRRRRNQSGS